MCYCVRIIHVLLFCYYKCNLFNHSDDKLWRSRMFITNLQLYQIYWNRTKYLGSRITMLKKPSWPWSYGSCIYNYYYAICAYHHWCCGFDSRPGRGVQHYVIKFVSDLRQVVGFLRVLWFPPPIKLTPRYNWNIVESGIKHHKTMQPTNI